MPPELFDVLAACPQTKTWKHPSRPAEPNLAGLRDRALILTGFVGALRRSELAALDIEHLREHLAGFVLELPRSKTNQRGEHTEPVVLPRAGNPVHCPVTVLTRWLDAASITTGPLFQGVTKSNQPTGKRLHPESINTLVQTAITRTGLDATGYSAHSLRAGFVTYAHLRGANDHAIAQQTRHRSLATIGHYIRIDNAWTNNAATTLGF